MKRFLLVVLAVFLMMPVFASNGDTLNIGGVVPLILDLVVTPSTNYDNLTLVGAAATVTAEIAQIDISTNNSAGWELWIYANNYDGARANPCALLNDDGDQIAYTLEFTGTGGSGAPAAVADANGTQFAESATDVDVVNGPLEITYNTSDTYPNGYYSDQLTIVLRAK